MSTSLSQFQDSFTQTLLAVAADPGPGMAALACQPGFAVYRNTVLKGCIDALQANYPSVNRLVGNNWFRTAAAIFVRTSLPHDARMMQYGEDFADFLAHFEPAAALPYLSDVARLDRLWIAAHAAVDQPPLDPATIACLAPEQLADIVLHPHPAAHWAWFTTQPIYTIWDRNRRALEDTNEIDWRGEGALLVRPHGTVVWIELDMASCAFLDACKAGQSLSEAVAAALTVRQDADIAQLLSTLLDAGTFGDITDSKRHLS